jgi:hypothetical protein
MELFSFGWFGFGLGWIGLGQVGLVRFGLVWLVGWLSYHLRVKMETGIDDANWIWLAQDRVQWQAFMNMVMNLQVP